MVRNHLSDDERKIFIELALTKMIKALHDELLPDTSNITCKYSMDRAPSTFCLFFVLEKLESKGNLSKKDCEELLTLLFTPSILAHNRGITTDRFKIFIQTFKHLINRSL